jgi:hypothetical protein
MFENLLYTFNMQRIYNVITVISTFFPQNMVTLGDFQPKNPLHKSQMLLRVAKPQNFATKEKANHSYIGCARGCACP